MIVLAAGAARLEVVPAMGAGLAGLWVDGRPALRPWSGRAGDGPFALAFNLLAPFSNRIAGGFDLDGRRIALAPNLAGEPWPIHGDAFQRPWQVAEAGAQSARLVLDEGAFGPWHYRAECRYDLAPGRLDIALALENRAAERLPYGLGFHPWFPRSPATRLGFAASGVWHETADHLRAADHPAPAPPEWDFAAARPLPEGFINNAFAGWGGSCEIVQGPEAAGLRMTAPGLSTLIVYSPSAAADFFCAEPVSHPVDAHNLPGRPGLTDLSPGETLAAAMTLAWDTA